MKNLYILVVFLAFISVSKAQNNIVDITQQGKIPPQTDLNFIPYGYYYKDLNHLLDPFVGTYVYAEGNTMLKIVLQKKEMSSINNLYYEDLIIGEYQFIKDGVERINTLSRLQENFAHAANYSIDGNLIIGYGSPGCRECAVDEKALNISIVDRISNSGGSLYIRRLTVNGQAAIKIFVSWDMKTVSEFETRIAPSIPPGSSFVLLKQQ